MQSNVTNSTLLHPVVASSDFNPAIGAITLTVAILIFGSNSLVLFVLSLFKPWAVHDVLVCSLVLSDCLNCLIPLQLLVYVRLTPSPLSPWTPLLCSLFKWFTFTFRVASVLTISMVCFDRYYSVKNPLVYFITIKQKRTKAIFFCAGIWFLSGCFAIGSLVFSPQWSPSNPTCSYQSHMHGFVFNLSVQAIGVSQMAFVLGCLYFTHRAASNFNTRQSLMTPHSSQDNEARTSLTRDNLSPTTKMIPRDRRSTTSLAQIELGSMQKTMLVIVVVFYTSWVPYLLSNLVHWSDGEPTKTEVTVIGIATLLTAMVNPVIYLTMSTRYRKGIRYLFQVLGYKLCGRSEPEAQRQDFVQKHRVSSLALRNIQEMRKLSIAEHLDKRTSFTDDPSPRLSPRRDSDSFFPPVPASDALLFYAGNEDPPMAKNPEIGDHVF